MKGISSVLLILVFGMTACKSEYDFYPKPRGFMRLDFPDRTYEVYNDSICPFSFEIPEYFSIVNKPGCNKDIEMHRFNATLYMTYLPIDTNLFENIEYSRKLVYDHSIKADAIEESRMVDKTRKAYGLKYVIKGDAASPYQFYVTDSVNHFLRGALYFNVKPNYDSVKTSLAYIVEDINIMLGTVVWGTKKEE